MKIFFCFAPILWYLCYLFLSIDEVSCKDHVDYLRARLRPLEEELDVVWENSKNGKQGDIASSLMNEVDLFCTELEKTQKTTKEILNLLHTIEPIKNSKQLLTAVMNIMETYDIFSRIQKNANKNDIIKFINGVLNSQNGVTNSLRDLEDLIGDEIYVRTKNELTEVKCFVQSESQVMHFLHYVISLSELKAHFLMEMASMFNKIYNETFQENIQTLRQKYYNTPRINADIISSFGNLLSRQIYNCDPDTPAEGTTYEQLTGIFQGYIVNEINLNKNQDCKKTCSDYKSTFLYSCLPSTFCEQQRVCKGNLISCYDYFPDMRVCLKEYNSLKRYDYILPLKKEDAGVVGSSEHCSTTEKSVQTWHHWSLSQCSYCFCFCDEAGNYSDRFFSIQASISNTTENMVVVGLRFIKDNRVIHLQVKEAKLLPFGQIDESTSKWVPVEPITVTDKVNKRVTNAQYHTLSAFSRSLDLDDIEADNNYILTGVQLKVVNDRLKLAIQTTGFDYHTGELIDAKKPVWKMNGISPDKIDSPKMPQKSEKMIAMPTKEEERATRLRKKRKTKNIGCIELNTLTNINLRCGFNVDCSKPELFRFNLNIHTGSQGTPNIKNDFIPPSQGRNEPRNDDNPDYPSYPYAPEESPRKKTKKNKGKKFNTPKEPDYDDYEEELYIKYQDYDSTEERTPKRKDNKKQPGGNKRKGPRKSAHDGDYDIPKPKRKGKGAKPPGYPYDDEEPPSKKNRPKPKDYYDYDDQEPPSKKNRPKPKDYYDYDDQEPPSKKNRKFGDYPEYDYQEPRFKKKRPKSNDYPKPDDRKKNKRPKSKDYPDYDGRKKTPNYPDDYSFDDALNSNLGHLPPNKKNRPKSPGYNGPNLRDTPKKKSGRKLNSDYDDDDPSKPTDIDCKRRPPSRAKGRPDADAPSCPAVPCPPANCLKIRCPKGFSTNRPRVKRSRMKPKKKSSKPKSSMMIDKNSGKSGRMMMKPTDVEDENDDEEEEPRKAVNLFRSDAPTRSPLESEMNLVPNMYIEFTSTDTVKDESQTSIPFIDIQPVQMVISRPLSGAGIYYKGQPGFGGYIGPKIITFDTTSHIEKSG